jgi:gluconokinase
MGVAGSGKSTVGRELARRLGWCFCDADDLHPPRNRDKMRRGIPLSDADRQPWLEAVHDEIARSLASKTSTVFACSALKDSYRQRLAVDHAAVRFVYLKGPRELIERRLADRQGHFFDPHLLASQFRDLEEPSDAIEVSIQSAPEAIAASIAAALGF